MLNAPRAAAFADFERLGFPTHKMEKYKYTDLSKYFEPDYGLNLNRDVYKRQVVARVDNKNNNPKIILSRTSPVFLQRL